MVAVAACVADFGNRIGVKCVAEIRRRAASLLVLAETRHAKLQSVVAHIDDDNGLGFQFSPNPTLSDRATEAIYSQTPSFPAGSQGVNDVKTN